MITKEITENFSIEELKSIRDDWHEIENHVKTTDIDKLMYDVTYDDEYYADRDIYTVSYTMSITTYKEEDNKTVLSDVIVLYDEYDEIGEVTIDELEEYIAKTI